MLVSARMRASRIVIVCDLLVTSLLLLAGLPPGGEAARTGKTLSSSRASTVRQAPSTSSYPRPRYSTTRFRLDGKAGFVFGYTAYLSRRRYIRNPNKVPTVCVNAYDHFLPNGTMQPYMVCPPETHDDEYRYCCGSNLRQHCCHFWQIPGYVAGVVIAILAFIIVCAIIIFCCCYRRLAKKNKEMKRQEMRAAYANQALKFESSGEVSQTSQQIQYPSYPSYNPSYPSKGSNETDDSISPDQGYPQVNSSSTDDWSAGQAAVHNYNYEPSAGGPYQYQSPYPKY